MKLSFRHIVVGSIAAVGFASVAIHPFGRPKGSSSNEALLSGASTSISVLQVFERSCQNCHSEKTEWPWYSYIAPASWAIESDVRNARGRLNISRWDEYSVEEKRALLASIGAAVRSHAMPLPRYLFLHPDAKLQDAEIERIYLWTKSERRRLAVSETPTGGGN